MYYNNDRDVYLPNLLMGVGIVLIMIAMNRYLSLWIIVMMMPMLGMYIRMISRLQRRLIVLESIKKGIVLFCVVTVGMMCVEFLYVLGYIIVVNGIIGMIYIRTYVFVIIGARM